jgi:hypothetical protein
MSLAHAKRHAHSRVAASIAAARAAGHLAYTAGRMLEGEDAAATVASTSNATNSTVSIPTHRYFLKICTGCLYSVRPSNGLVHVRNTHVGELGGRR